ncbi:MAG: hypothetical protein ACRD2Y_02160 [Terriglobales bacterium]
MLNRAAARIVSVLMVVALPLATTLADTHAAMAYVQGSASVNGRPVSQSVAVFPGDAIQTEARSTISLSLKGSSVLVTENSAVTFGESEVTITSGSAQVRTSKGLTARVASLSVVPTSAKPVAYEVVRRGAEVRITAVNGSLAVSDGKATTLLESGKSLSLRTDGKALPQPAAPKNSISGETGLIIVVFTAIAAGVAVGIANAQDDSPIVP